MTAQHFGRVPNSAWAVLFWGLAIGLAITSPKRRIGITGMAWWLLAILPVATQVRSMFPYYLDLALPGAALLVGAAASHVLDLLRFRVVVGSAVLAVALAFGLYSAPVTMSGSFIKRYKARSVQLLHQRPTGRELTVKGSRPLDTETTRDGDMWRIEFNDPRLVVRFDGPQQAQTAL
jgi:hypothetical protein